jgi:hypothetical protein
MSSLLRMLAIAAPFGLTGARGIERLATAADGQLWGKITDAMQLLENRGDVMAAPLAFDASALNEKGFDALQSANRASARRRAS